MDDVAAMTPAQYRAYLDDEVLAFIAETESWYPPGASARAIGEQRRSYDAMCRSFFAGYPQGVAAEDLTADGVRLRAYHRADGVVGTSVIYAHGGGFILGGLDSHDDICAEICAAGGLDVIAVDYRLLPENDRGDADEDVCRALNWLRRDRGGRVILAGDSAGAALVITAAMRDRGVGDLAGQVLIYPGLTGLGGVGGSMRRHAFAPLLSAEDVAYYVGHARPASGGTVRAEAMDFSGLPPAFVAAAECDPLCDEAVEYANRIRRAGGQAVLSMDHGLVHGHLRARGRSRRARASFDRVIRAICLMADGALIDTAVPPLQSRN